MVGHIRIRWKQIYTQVQHTDLIMYCDFLQAEVASAPTTSLISQQDSGATGGNVLTYDGLLKSEQVPEKLLQNLHLIESNTMHSFVHLLS